jgi:hypothetical protein
MELRGESGGGERVGDVRAAASASARGGDRELETAQNASGVEGGVGCAFFSAG